jgi:hypothetical protein
VLLNPLLLIDCHEGEDIENILHTRYSHMILAGKISGSSRFEDQELYARYEDIGV